MNEAELLERAIVFYAGPPPAVNQYILQEHHKTHTPMTVEKRDVSWVICSGPFCLEKESEELVHEKYFREECSTIEEFYSKTRFATPQEAFAFLFPWKEKIRKYYNTLPHMQHWEE